MYIGCILDVYYTVLYIPSDTPKSAMETPRNDRLART